jgi:alkyl sulfatase BDS1-like metallo-beta-lactamase superfamily hydrolase
LRRSTRPFIAIALAAILGACGASPPAPAPPPPANPAALAAHSQLFRKGVEEVTEGVYAAIGYSLANSILLEGEDGVVIVDTLESRGRAEEVLAAFRAITDKPIRAVILTHNHADHVFGGQVFTGGDPSIPVYAHATTSAEIDRVVSVTNDATYGRSMRMFGQLLRESGAPNAGIGPGLDFHADQMALARPTHTFEDRLDLEIAGIRIQLIHAPGETPDQICVWLPDKKVLIPADNIYQAFPNLYTIRGTAYRDVLLWVETLDQMRTLEAEFLVPCHTRPLVGRDPIAETLTAYRDAIQYVHDQTVRGMNQGKSPGVLAATIRLPPHLEQHPWLQPFYGTVPWSVKGIYDGYLGWFDGNGATLDPLPPAERSGRWLEAFTAGVPLPDQARQALDQGDFSWAAELADHWLRVAPEDPAARAALATALDALGAQHPSANGQNYLRTQAAELRGDLVITPTDKSTLPDDFLESLPLDRFMRALPVRLKAEETFAIDELATFHFSDLNVHYTIHLRRGIAEVRAVDAPGAPLAVTTTSTTWKRLATKKLNPAIALATGDLQVEGGILALRRFLAFFDNA